MFIFISTLFTHLFLNKTNPAFDNTLPKMCLSPNFSEIYFACDTLAFPLSQNQFPVFSFYDSPLSSGVLSHLVTHSCLTLWDPMDCSTPGSSVHGDSPGKNICPLAGDRPNTGIEPRSPTLQADSLPSDPPGKPKKIGGGSLSLLQGIFLTQESNWGLMYYRKILYQLSYQGLLLHIFKFNLQNVLCIFYDI